MLLRKKLFNNISLEERRLKSSRENAVAKFCLYCRWIREQHSRISLTILRWKKHHGLSPLQSSERAQMNQHTLAEHRKKSWAQRAAVLEKNGVETQRQQGVQEWISQWGRMAAVDGH